jgi:hypothetical protein
MNGTSSKKSWQRTAGHRLVVTLAVLLLATGSAQAAGACTTALIEEPFRLPDGSLHPSGELTLCLERSFSPIASLHEVRVDNMGIGLFMGRRETSLGLGDDPRPFMMFQRLSGGELLLVGVARPLRDRMQVHYLARGNWDTQIDPRQRIARVDDPALVRVTASSL